MPTRNATRSNGNGRRKQDGRRKPGGDEGAHEVAAIRLDRLAAGADNVRVTPPPEAAERELVASIRAHGLLENLIVTAAADAGRYDVIGGRRRYRALCTLAREGHIRADEPVACTVVTGADRTEVGLAENTVRVEMHPSDQIDAFSKLVRAGRPLTEIANRFGVEPLDVERMLRLEGVHPDIREAHRADVIGTPTLAAYAMTTDHGRQLRVWKHLGEAAGGGARQKPEQVRALLKAETLDGTDRLVRFVGVDAYRAAGGVIYEDLFTGTDDPEAALVADAPKLRQMAADKLQQAAIELAGQWEWVDPQIERGWAVEYSYGTIAADVPATPTEAETARMAAIGRRQEEIAALLGRIGPDGTAGGESREDLGAEQGRLGAELAAIEDEVAARAGWSERVRKLTGCIVSVTDGGALDIVGGLVRPEDIERVRTALNPEPEPEAGPEREPEQEPAAAAGATGGDEGGTGAGAEPATGDGGSSGETAAPEAAGGRTGAPDGGEAHDAPAAAAADAAAEQAPATPVRIEPPVNHEWQEKPPGEATEPAVETNPYTDACRRHGYTTGLAGDIRTARRAIVADALAADPDTAELLATFQLAEQAAGAVEARGSDDAGTADEPLPLDIELDHAARKRVLDRGRAGALRGAWRQKGTRAERFAALAALDTGERRAVLAAAVAALAVAQASFEPGRSSVLEAAVGRLRPAWREAWSPDEQQFLARLTRDHLLALGERFGGDEWVGEHRHARREELARAVRKLFDDGAPGTAEWAPAGFEPEEESTAAAAPEREADGVPEEVGDEADELPAFLDDMPEAGDPADAGA